MRVRIVWLLVLSAASLVLAWFYVVPAALGGRATYVVTHGVSMEPRFHTGDLAVVYPASRYVTGDVAAYRSDLLGTTVLHRIIGTSGDRLVFQGDNNTWVDPEQPTAHQVVGRLAVRIPHGGVLLGSLHQPLVLGLLATAILVSGATGAVGLRRRRRRRTRAERAPMTPPSSIVSARSPRAWSAVAATVALGSAALALFTYVAPSDAARTETVAWTTRTTYSYSARTTPNLIYPDGRVSSGQPVFRSLVDQLQIGATWSASTSAPHAIGGSARLRAVVQGAGGWTHPIDLGAAKPVTGDRVTLSGTLDLRALDGIVKSAGALTGTPSDRYTVSVQPELVLHGSVGGRPVPGPTARGGSPLVLTVTPSTVGPGATTAGADSNGSGALTTPNAGTDGSASWLEPAPKTDSIVVTSPGAATWPFLGRRVPLSVVRSGSIAVGLLAMCLALLLLRTRRRSSDPCGDTVRRHRKVIIPVDTVDVAPQRNVVDVASLEALLQVAQRYDRLVLQLTSSGGTYLVEDETGLYRYRCTHQHRDEGHRRHLAPRGQRSDRAFSESA